MSLKKKAIRLLRWSEKYTNTDMVYLAKGSFWHTFDRGLTFLIGFVTMSVLSRWLAKETFGAYQYILSVIGILGISTLAMGKALTRAISKAREGMLMEVAKEKSKWSLLGVAVSLAIAGWYWIQGNLTLSYSFLMASFLFPLPRIFNSYTPFWQGRKRFDINARHTVGINFMEAVIFLPVVFLTNNLLIVLLAYFLSRAIFRGIAFKYALSKVKNNEKDNETITFGKHLTAINVISTISNNIDRVLIWQFLGPIQVAIFSFAKLPINKIKGVLPISTVALPKLSEKSKPITNNLMKKFFKAFLFTIPVALIIYAIMPYLYQVVFPDYLDSVPYARALTFIIALAPFSLLQTALIAEMKKKELYIIKVATPLLKISLFLILISIYQLWGLIVSILVSEVANGLITIYLFKRK